MFVCALSKNIENLLTDYVRLRFNLFVTFAGRFAGIQCLIYLHIMPEK